MRLPLLVLVVALVVVPLLVSVSDRSLLVSEQVVVSLLLSVSLKSPLIELPLSVLSLVEQRDK